MVKVKSAYIKISDMDLLRVDEVNTMTFQTQMPPIPVELTQWWLLSSISYSMSHTLFH